MSVILTLTTATAAGALQTFTKSSPSAPVFTTELRHWIISFFSITLFVNLCCTGKPLLNTSSCLHTTDYVSSSVLIAGRIRWVQQSTRDTDSQTVGRSLGPAIIVVVESGVIYSVCLVLLLVLYVTSSFAQYILLDAVCR